MLKALDNALKTLQAAMLSRDKTAILSARAAVVATHAALLKQMRKRDGFIPEWATCPLAQDFFSQWESADITRVLVLGRRW